MSASCDMSWSTICIPSTVRHRATRPQPPPTFSPVSRNIDSVPSRFCLLTLPGCATPQTQRGRHPGSQQGADAPPPPAHERPLRACRHDRASHHDERRWRKVLILVFSLTPLPPFEPVHQPRPATLARPCFLTTWRYAAGRLATTEQGHTPPTEEAGMCPTSGGAAPERSEGAAPPQMRGTASARLRAARAPCPPPHNNDRSVVRA
jgi:hypothetical protein